MQFEFGNMRCYVATFMNACIRLGVFRNTRPVLRFNSEMLFRPDFNTFSLLLNFSFEHLAKVLNTEVERKREKQFAQPFSPCPVVLWRQVNIGNLNDDYSTLNLVRYLANWRGSALFVSSGKEISVL